MSQSDAPVLALDVPSGVDASSGDSAGAHVGAATTMTLALPKTGLDVGAVGDLWVADIGIPRSVLERAGIPQPRRTSSHGDIGCASRPRRACSAEAAPEDIEGEQERDSDGEEEAA